METYLAYTVKQLAELTPISEVKWRRLIKTGEVRVKRVGRRVVIPADELRRFLSVDPPPPV